MRSKFFYFTLMLLLFTVVASTALNFYFFSTERKLLIDQQIEASASALIASNFSQQLLENMEEVDDILKDVLGEERVNLAIGIFDLKGNLLYRNAVGRKIPIDLVDQLGWSDIEIEDHQVRVLTISTRDLIIQVGLVLDSTIERWRGSSQRTFAYLFFLIIFIVVVAFMSSSYFFAPVRTLAKQFRGLTEKLKGNFGKSFLNFELPLELQQHLSASNPKDEIMQLAVEIGNFITAISEYSKNVEAQSAVLTHELKTPLTVLYSLLERADKEPESKQKDILLKQSMAEVRSIATLVNTFLQWAVFSSSSDNLELYAVKIDGLLEDVVSELDRIYPERIVVQKVETGTALALPQHLRQLIRNLIENALKYSPADSKVFCEFTEEYFLVKDSGPGISSEVIQSLGTPFNRGAKRKESSYGLGLAWVNSICHRYDWKLFINSRQIGTEIRIDFRGPSGLHSLKF